MRKTCENTVTQPFSYSKKLIHETCICSLALIWFLMSKWGSFHSGVLPANSIQWYVNFMFNMALTYLGCQLASKNPIWNPWVYLTWITHGWRSEDLGAGIFNQCLWITCCIILQRNSIECWRNPTQRNALWVAQQAPEIWGGICFA